MSQADKIRERIKALIKDRETTATAVSREIGDRSYLGKFFAGAFENISTGKLLDIAKALETTPQYLTGETFTPSAPQQARTLPVMGRAAAATIGSMHALDDPIDWLPMPPKLANVREAYALTVEGESMLERYRDGDPIFINPHQTVRKGDIVVVQEQRGDSLYASVKEFSHRTEKSVIVHQFNPKDAITFEARNVAAIHRVLDWREVLGL